MRRVLHGGIVIIGQFANQLLAKGIELAVRKSGRLYIWPKFEAATRTGALIYKPDR